MCRHRENMCSTGRMGIESEADHPGPEMEGERDGTRRLGFQLRRNQSTQFSLICAETGLFRLLLGELQTKGSTANGVRGSRVSIHVRELSYLRTQLVAPGVHSNSQRFVIKSGTWAKS